MRIREKKKNNKKNRKKVAKKIKKKKKKKRTKDFFLLTFLKILIGLWLLSYSQFIASRMAEGNVLLIPRLVDVLRHVPKEKIQRVVNKHIKLAVTIFLYFFKLTFIYI